MPTNLEKWPGRVTPENPAISNSTRIQEEPHPTKEEILDLVANSPLINNPNTYTIYSNIGFDLLGLANVAANRQASEFKATEPKSHKELLKRDIFNPLGLHSSFFDNPTPEQHARLVVPKTNSEWAVRVYILNKATCLIYALSRIMTLAMQKILLAVNVARLQTLDASSALFYQPMAKTASYRRLL